MTLLQKCLPLVSQLADYGQEKLRGDLSAGLTVGVMFISPGVACPLIGGLSENLGAGRFVLGVHDAVEAAGPAVETGVQGS